MVCRLDRRKMFRSRSVVRQGGVFDRHSAAERHRHPAPRPRPEQRAAGHPGPPRPPGGQGSAVAARHRPRRHRHPGEGRARAARDRKARPAATSAATSSSSASGISRTNTATSSSSSSSASAARATGAASASPWTRPTRSGCSHVFVELFKQGLIYRGKRIVNWCPVSLTALSDEEVIMTPQRSKLYFMKYELADAPGEYLEISTTRPETLDGRRGGGRESEGPALCEIRRPQGVSAVSACGDPGHRRRSCGHRVRHRRAENHPGPRQGGLRDRHAPRARRSSMF